MTSMLKKPEREMDRKLKEIARLAAESKKSIRDDVNKLKADVIDDINGRIHSVDSRLALNAEDVNILNEKLRDLELSIAKVSNKPGEMDDEMKKFKEYVTSYMNSLAENYDEKFRSVKMDVDRKLHRIKA